MTLKIKTHSTVESSKTIFLDIYSELQQKDLHFKDILRDRCETCASKKNNKTVSIRNDGTNKITMINVQRDI